MSVMRGGVTRPRRCRSSHTMSGTRSTCNVASSCMKTERESETFESNPIAKEALERMGMTTSSNGDTNGGKPNKKVVYGVFTADVTDIPSDEERARRREAAAASLTNIDDAERARRRNVGTIALVVSIGLAVLLYARGVGGVQRFLYIFFPFNLGLGFYRSAQNGL